MGESCGWGRGGRRDRRLTMMCLELELFMRPPRPGRGSAAVPLLQEADTRSIDEGGWRRQVHLPELDVSEPEPPSRVVQRLDAYRVSNEGPADNHELATEADHAVRRARSFDNP